MASEATLTLRRLRQPRRLSPDLPLALMSGYPTHEVIQHLDGLKLTGYRQKPFRLTALGGLLPWASDA